MTHQLMQRELVIDLPTGEFHIRPINDERIIGPVDYGWVRFNEAAAADGRADPVVFTWGGGPLAGSRIPGTRRLVFCAYSPLWEGFYDSSLGGAAYIMHRIGVDFVCLRGSAPQDSVLILNHQNGEITVRLEPIHPDVIWARYADPLGQPLTGFYALQQAVFDRYHHEFEGDNVRVFAVGPAARITNQGIIGSNHVKKGLITPIDDWAGRGGLGSRLLQTHRIAACIFGGSWEDPDLKDSKEIDSYFQQYYGDSMIKVDLGATEKYRYVPGFQTGGTFGVNMHTAEDKLLSFNYASVYESSDARLRQHENFIINHYLKQFNEEIIAPKNFSHCGEPCSVACKKFSGIYKKDYEPYQALGPLCGIFDQRAAEELNHFVDAMSLDAIQAGGTAAWIMELIRDGLLDPGAFDLPPASELRFTFASQAEEFDVVADSRRNAAYAQSILSMILFEPAGELFRQGIRAAAARLDAQMGLTRPGQRVLDRAVFTAHGEQGCMTPNQYWVPGMIASPMPMMGKYYVYYGLEFLPPRELGKRCVYRMVYELFSENTGVCRFHRKWVEAIVDEIISAHYDFPVDYKAHQFELARAIYEREGAAVHFVDSDRLIAMIRVYLEGWAAEGLNNPDLAAWVRRFQTDERQAARDYWEEMRQGIAEAFAAGPAAVPDVVAPYQAAKLDVMEKNKPAGR